MHFWTLCVPCMTGAPSLSLVCFRGHTLECMLHNETCEGFKGAAYTQNQYYASSIVVFLSATEHFGKPESPSALLAKVWTLALAH